MFWENCHFDDAESRISQESEGQRSGFEMVSVDDVINGKYHQKRVAREAVSLQGKLALANPLEER